MIAVGLWDIFHTLLHPKGQGRLTGLVLSTIWWASRGVRHRVGTLVGPAAMVTVVIKWIALQMVGWALIYYPHIPGGFEYSPGVSPSQYSNALEALYVSTVTLATLGYGDVVATEPWIRVATPFEALTGFALLTAALTWFGQLYPPLTRRRSLALELKGLADAGYAERLGDVDAATVCRVLDSLTTGIGTVRVDLIQHAECFYFLEQDPGLSLARQLAYTLRLHEAAMARQEPGVRLSAQRLVVALEELTSKLQDFNVPGETPAEVMASYATEHGRSPRT